MQITRRGSIGLRRGKHAAVRNYDRRKRTEAKTAGLLVVPYWLADVRNRHQAFGIWNLDNRSGDQVPGIIGLP
jgi:hypothetical protein